MSTSFHIASPKFVGPIELLLQLVRKRKLHISEIALGQVAESFLEHFRQMPDMPLHHSTHFLGVVAVLVYVKSQSLLPGTELDEEGDSALQELAGRVELYALLEQAVDQLRTREQQVQLVVRSPMKLAPVGFQPDPSVTAYRLQKTLQHLLRRNEESIVSTKERAKQTLRPRIALQRVLETIREAVVSAKKPATLSALVLLVANDHSDGVAQIDAKIGSLLAALEMAREDAVDLGQAGHFSEITIYPKLS